jgi:hypothetical protein
MARIPCGPEDGAVVAMDSTGASKVMHGEGGQGGWAAGWAGGWGGGSVLAIVILDSQLTRQGVLVFATVSGSVRTWLSLIACQKYVLNIRLLMKCLILNILSIRGFPHISLNFA